MAIKELLENRELKTKINELIAVERALAKEKEVGAVLWARSQGIDQDADIYKLAWWQWDEGICTLKRKRKAIIKAARALVLADMGLS